MRVAVDRHDDVLRTAIELQDGYVFSIAGDSFCAACHRLDDAVEAAVEAQRALATGQVGDPEIKVRMVFGRDRRGRHTPLERSREKPWEPGAWFSVAD